MELGDPGEALRAKAELAKRHAEEVREDAQRQREKATEIRDAERQAVDAAKAKTDASVPFLRCGRCSAVWRADAVAEAVRREPRCLLCGGPLAPVP
jgi:hypothetical protein